MAKVKNPGSGEVGRPRQNGGYASPYYDPDKAHEYYINHYKAKGRRTTTGGLTEKGRIAAQTVKSAVNSEKKAKLEAHKNDTNKKIAALRAQLKAMDKKTRLANKQRIQNEIKKLRDANKAYREQLTKEYDDKFANEIDEIRKDSSMVNRKSTVFLNGEGREEAEKAKERVQADQEKAIQDQTKKVRDEIVKLRFEYANMSKKQRQRNRSRITTQISALRESHQKAKQEIAETYKEKYLEELDKIRAQKKYTD